MQKTIFGGLVVRSIFKLVLLVTVAYGRAFAQQTTVTGVGPSITQIAPSGPIVEKALPPVANTFLACDGYRQPKASSDSFITARDLFGLFNVSDEDIRQSEGLTLSADSVAYCDAALADPTLTEKMTARRMNLLHAKALHQMVAGDNIGALATLDRARAVKLDLPPEMRADGFDIINSAETALALIRLGRNSDARPIIDQIEKQRPYAIAILNIADSLRAISGASLDTEIARARTRAVLAPGTAFRALNLAFLARRFEDVVYLGEGLTLTLPNTDRWRVDGQSQAKYTFISNRAALAGMVSYAEAAQGKSDLAASRIKAARALLENEMIPPPLPADGHAVPKHLQQEYEVRKSWGTQGSKFLDAWEKAIGLRQRAQT